MGLQGCFQPEKTDPCLYTGLNHGPVSAQDSVIIRAILDSNLLDSISVSGVNWYVGELDFSYMKLDSFYFPAVSAQLQSIKVLRFYENRLKSVPKNISLIRGVEELWLSNNLISTLPDELFAMTGIKKMYLGNNLLTGVPSKIGDLNSLMYLDLAGNSLFSLPPEITKLSASLNGCGYVPLFVSNNYLCNSSSAVEAFLNRFAENDWRKTQVCP